MEDLVAGHCQHWMFHRNSNKELSGGFLRSFRCAKISCAEVFTAERRHTKCGCIRQRRLPLHAEVFKILHEPAVFGKQFSDRHAQNFCAAKCIHKALHAVHNIVAGLHKVCCLGANHRRCGRINAAARQRAQRCHLRRGAGCRLHQHGIFKHVLNPSICQRARPAEPLSKQLHTAVRCHKLRYAIRRRHAGRSQFGAGSVDCNRVQWLLGKLAFAPGEQLHRLVAGQRRIPQQCGTLKVLHNAAIIHQRLRNWIAKEQCAAMRLIKCAEDALHGVPGFGEEQRSAGDGIRRERRLALAKLLAQRAQKNLRARRQAGMELQHAVGKVLHQATIGNLAGEERCAQRIRTMMQCVKSAKRRADMHVRWSRRAAAGEQQHATGHKQTAAPAG